RAVRDAQVGRYVAAFLQDRLALGREQEIGEEGGGVRVRRPGDDADAVGATDRRRDREPFHRRAALLHLLRAVAVGGERERDFARGDQARQQRVALAHRKAVRAHDVAEEAQARL